MSIPVGVTMSKSMRWMIEQISSENVSSNFYGKIIFSFENAKLTHVKKEETIKPPKEYWVD